MYIIWLIIGMFLGNKNCELCIVLELLNLLFNLYVNQMHV